MYVYVIYSYYYVGKRIVCIQTNARGDLPSCHHYNIIIYRRPSPRPSEVIVIFSIRSRRGGVEGASEIRGMIRAEFGPINAVKDESLFPVIFFHSEMSI